MKKKLLSALLCVAMVASLVVGCNKSETVEEKVELTETEERFEIKDGEYTVLDVRESYAAKRSGPQQISISLVLEASNGDRFYFRDEFINTRKFPEDVIDLLTLIEGDNVVIKDGKITRK